MNIRSFVRYYGMIPVRIIETGDGSHSLLHTALDETYHSRHGALRESEHVFIRHGLRDWAVQHPSATRLRILEVGMGTGLNVILTVREARQNPNLSIYYTTLEPYPLTEAVVTNLNYLSLLGDVTLDQHFSDIHYSTWEEDQGLLVNFTLHKTRSLLADFSQGEGSYDLVYFDAFAPNKQAELWTRPILQKVVKLMALEAVFVTYSARGQLKRDLKSLGLRVETLVGPPGKAEMVQAHKVNP